MTKQDIVETRVKDNLLPTLVKKNYSFSKKWLYGLFVTLTCTKKLKKLILTCGKNETFLRNFQTPCQS